MYIVGVHKEDNKIKELDVIYSLDRPDIEFQWSVDVVAKGILKGNAKRTAYWTYDKKTGHSLNDGSDVFVVETNDGYELRTSSNGELIDNLGELPANRIETRYK